MPAETPMETVKRYLVDAIAAEKNFEDMLRANAKDGAQGEVHALFQQHAEETKRQYERLSARLHSLGGSESTFKSMMAHMFGFMPKVGQLGHYDEERDTQNLMMAYAVENGEVAMYEALAVAADAAGDTETERLAREIQAEERQTAEKVFRFISPSSRDAFQKLTART